MRKRSIIIISENRTQNVFIRILLNNIRIEHKYLLFLFISIISLSCDDFNYSPYAYDIDLGDKSTTSKNLEILSNTNKSTEDTIRFVVIGDVQRFYDETIEVVDAINRNEDLEFAIQDGDITDFGTLQEFEAMKGILSNLKVPFFTVIGNHDCIANGKEIYKKMFGEYNYSFIHKRIKFIFINTNSREFKFNGNIPDNNWLAQQLIKTDEFDNSIVICHVPPDSSDFDANLSNEFKSLLGNADHLLTEINGHGHNYGVKEINGVTYINTDATEKNTYLRFKIYNGQFSFEKVKI